jgi:hypothetical protein
MILVELLIVVLAAVAAWFYPIYGAGLPLQIGPLEAHIMTAYLVIIGGIFVAVRRRAKIAPAPETPAIEPEPAPTASAAPPETAPPNATLWPNAPSFDKNEQPPSHPNG